MSDDTRQARPAEQVLRELLDPCRAKSEHEWVAARKIESLQDEIERLNSLIEALTARNVEIEAVLRYIPEVLRKFIEQQIKKATGEK